MHVHYLTMKQNYKQLLKLNNNTVIIKSYFKLMFLLSNNANIKCKFKYECNFSMISMIENSVIVHVKFEVLLSRSVKEKKLKAHNAIYIRTP